MIIIICLIWANISSKYRYSTATLAQQQQIIPYRTSARSRFDVKPRKTNKHLKFGTESSAFTSCLLKIWNGAICAQGLTSCNWGECVMSIARHANWLLEDAEGRRLSRDIIKRIDGQRNSRLIRHFKWQPILIDLTRFRVRYSSRWISFNLKMQFMRASF